MLGRRLLVAFGAVLLGVLATPVAAAAGPSHGRGCDQRIYDPKHQLGQHVPADVQHDVDRLSRAGATVRVRVYGRVRHGSVSAAEAGDQAACSDWTDGGHRASRLLVVAVAIPDRQTGIYYGAHWNRALNGSWRGIQQHDMNVEFKHGHYAAGLHRGLMAIDQNIHLPQGKDQSHYRPPSENNVVMWLWLGILVSLLLVVPVHNAWRTWRTRSDAWGPDSGFPDTYGPPRIGHPRDHYNPASQFGRHAGGLGGFGGGGVGGGGGAGGGGGSTGW